MRAWTNCQAASSGGLTSRKMSVPARQGKGDQGHQADATGDETRNTFRVDQDLADFQTGDKGRRHSGPVPLQELDQVEVRPDGDNQLGTLLEGEQQRYVLADTRR